MSETDKGLARAGVPAERSLEAHPGNYQHGTHHERAPIIRALLPDDEAEAWDRAPVPGNCPEMLEEIFREFCVLKFRVHKWESNQEKADAVSSLQARIDLLKVPLRGLLKAIEVHARIIEVETGVGQDSDAVAAYLRSLPSHQLESYVMEGEAPRFHPGTGLPLIEAGQVVPAREIDRGPEPDPGHATATDATQGEVEEGSDAASLPPWHPDRLRR
jgi:hypothetical protein